MQPLQNYMKPIYGEFMRVADFAARRISAIFPAAPFVPATTLHLAVDLHEEYRELLKSPARRANFLVKAERLASALHGQGVETMAIAHGEYYVNNFEFYTGTRAGASRTILNYRRHQLTQYQISLPTLKDEQDLAIKFNFNAFNCGALSRELKTRNIQDILVSGANTNVCVLATVKGALKAGFRAHVVVDEVADCNAKAGEDENVHWHRRQLALLNLKYPHRLKLVSKNDVLASLRPTSVRELRPAPA